MNKRQCKKKLKKILLVNLEESLKEVSMIRKGLLSVKTWSDLKKELNLSRITL